MANAEGSLYTNIGVDTGGTFTDLVMIDSKGGIHTEKSFSTPGKPQQGVFEVLEQASKNLHSSIPSIIKATKIFSHGTTVSTNTLITRRGAKVGVLFTEGFEDTLAIGRGPIGRVGGLPQSIAMDFLHTEPPEPFVASDMVRGIPERIDSAGNVVAPIDLEATRNAISELIAAGTESFAICLLWAFRNPTHETIIEAICNDLAPDIPVSLSSKIAPRIGEFERAVTTIANAYVGPITINYIEQLNRGLCNYGLSHPIQIVTSSGGAARATDMKRQAVSVINSGPVAGLIAARFLGDTLGHERIITADMGGTSFDVGLIDGDTLEEDPRPFLDQGLPVSLPAVKLVTIGAGGGSVAWTDGYRLHVGPQSAGSEPGPAAYGRGGKEPTVTDALIICGIIDPTNFFGGKYELDPDLSARAVMDRIATPLKINLHDAAAGILEIVNARMANLIRKVSIESGHDPQNFTLYAYGGATGAHCAEFTQQLNIGKLILPYAGPVFSALGAAICDLRYEHSRSEPMMLGSSAIRVANRCFEDLKKAACADIENAGLNEAHCEFRRRIEMRYQGQLNEILLNLEGDKLTRKDIEVLRNKFETRYEERFGPGTTRPEAPLELISYRMEARHPNQRPGLAKLETGKPTPRKVRKRKVFIRGKGFITADVHDFKILDSKVILSGPSIIERDTTTIWVPPGQIAEMDDYGNISISGGKT